MKINFIKNTVESLNIKTNNTLEIKRIVADGNHEIHRMIVDQLGMKVLDKTNDSQAYELYINKLSNLLVPNLFGENNELMYFKFEE